MSHLLISPKLRKAIPAHLANGLLGAQGSDTGLAVMRSFLPGVTDLTPADHFRMALLPSWNGFEVRANLTFLGGVNWG